MSLSIGSPAPPFNLSDAEGNAISLASLKGKWVVLYFYPRDNTPGCIKEACAFRDLQSEFTAKNAIIYGVSTDDAKSHNKFITKFNLPFQLLIDEDGVMSTEYESYGLKKFMGKEYMGISRNTVLIDPDGTIFKIYKKVKPELHPEVVLNDIP
jgi:thioredoxin-dependent peroxiredoxin